MSSPTESHNEAPLDLSKWRNLPYWLMAVGGIGAVAGFFSDPGQFGFSWLLAYMFFLSLCLGALGMVLLHHLFDASWSVPIRRICEHLACLLFPWMLLLFLPIAFLAPRLYEWMRLLKEHVENKVPLEQAVAAKLPLFTMQGFYLVAAVCFVVWWLIPRRLRYWSLEQDKTGAAECTRKLRRYSATGVFLFAITLTLAAIMWMKALQHEWYSTMYGVWYFAESMWVALFTIYLLVVLLKRQGPLRDVATDKTLYFTGSLMFAFTVFYAYASFFQYFIVWNANIPEETFWYVLREKGTWWDIGMVIIFGHFLVPFLLLLRIDVKVSKLWIMVPLVVWAWAMHFVDMSFQIMPAKHPNGFVLHWMDLACMAFIGGVLARVFIRDLNAHPIIPQKDPRFAEAMDIYVPSGAKSETGGGH
jgi:hypothetical protein